MKINGLDGKQHTWIPSNNIVKTENRSSLHLKARDLLKKRFPNDRILEELVLPGTKTSFRKTTLRADFFIPNRGIIVEVHGEQHSNCNSFFYNNKMQFYKAKARDKDKKRWCELNNFTLIELLYDETIEQWEDKIWKM